MNGRFASLRRLPCRANLSIVVTGERDGTRQDIVSVQGRQQTR